MRTENYSSLQAYTPELKNDRKAFKTLLKRARKTHRKRIKMDGFTEVGRCEVKHLTALEVHGETALLEYPFLKDFINYVITSPVKRLGEN